MDKISRVKMVLEAAGLEGIKPQADNVWACCPYHDENTPSFRMHEDGYFYCFGCKKGGGIFQFMYDHLGFNFKTAKMWLEKFKIEFDPTGLAEDEYDKIHAPPPDDKLRDSILGQYAFCPDYMVERGFRPDVLEDFEIGYNYQTCRVTIPLRDVDGHLVGISERATEDKARHRYIHPPIYSQHLYLLHRNRREQVLPVFEGQLKCLWAHQEMGVPSISGMSSNLTHDQARILVGLDLWLILFFDGDSAGAKGTMLALKTLAEHGARSKVRIAWPYPEGKDQPDELTRGEFFQMLDNPVSAHECYEDFALLDLRA